jgi:GNAT superfamily N-acetyltransferase
VKQRAARQPPPTKLSAPAPHEALEPPKVLGEHEGVKFRRERLAPILREIQPLLKRDWLENGIDREAAPLEIDFARYLDMDLVGILQIITARDEELLVGYAFAYVHPHIDHCGVGWAMLTWYWLFPEYRHAGIGNAMIEAMEGFLREAKVSVVEVSEKITSKHGLFDRRGYRDVDVVKRKLLES